MKFKTQDVGSNYELCCRCCCCLRWTENERIHSVRRTETIYTFTHQYHTEYNFSDIQIVECWCCCVGACGEFVFYVRMDALNVWVCMQSHHVCEHGIMRSDCVSRARSTIVYGIFGGWSYFQYLFGTANEQVEEWANGRVCLRHTQTKAMYISMIHFESS